MKMNEETSVYLTALFGYMRKLGLQVVDRDGESVDIEMVSDAFRLSLKPDEVAWQRWVDVYFEFHQKHVGARGRMTGADGKALKEIVRYLIGASKDKSEAGALLAWEYILNNWARLSDFVKRQVSLTQINKNLPEILTTLRHGGANKQADKEATTNNLANSIAARRAERYYKGSDDAGN